MNINRHTLLTKALFIAAATLVLNSELPSSNLLAEGKPTEEVEVVKGPHGGRLLGSEEFQTEVTIYEPDIPPQSRVYFYENGKPLDPSLVQLSMELHRIDRVDVFSYRKQDDYLIGDKVVEEPHSFDVKIEASYNGKVHEWGYSSYEGRTELSKEAVESAGIVVEPAGPAKISSKIQFNGRIVPNEYRLLHVTPRFSGVVKSINKELGDTVEKNDLLAVIESNESLSAYEVRSKIEGTVIQRNVSLGEVVSESDDMFVVADLSTVWADLNVYRQDISKLKKGQPVFIHGSTPDAETVEATITYISPVSMEDTQTFLARAVLPNPNLTWRPGLYVVGDVVLEERDVPIAVKASAIQSFRDWDVVFRQVDNLFEIAILELGHRDGDWVEVLSGLEPNSKYVTENSFVVKADVLKSGASHDH
jgi:cobalt-zinc-cadmium efflux system membrane fusion protein